MDYTRVGLCIDTQHAFAFGICKFQTYEDVIKLFDMSNSITNKLYMSNNDRHSPALKRPYLV